MNLPSLLDGNRWGYFPSFSVGWRISEEPWMKKATSNWLDNLKLRATLGWIGSANAVGRYDTQSVVEVDNRYYTFGNGQTNSAGTGTASNAPAPLIENLPILTCLGKRPVMPVLVSIWICSVTS